MKPTNRAYGLMAGVAFIFSLLIGAPSPQTPAMTPISSGHGPELVAAAVVTSNAPARASVPPAPATSCLASYYAEGTTTAYGHPFNPEALTAASRSLPDGTRARVTRLDTAGHEIGSVLVTVTDRGPSWRQVRRGRCIDLSRAAMRQLGGLDAGVIPVRVEAIR